MPHQVSGIDGPAIEASIVDWYAQAHSRYGLHLWLSNADQDVVIGWHSVIFPVLLLLFGCCARTSGGGFFSFWYQLVSAVLIFVLNYTIYVPDTLDLTTTTVASVLTLWTALLTVYLQQVYINNGGFGNWLLLVLSALGLLLAASRSNTSGPTTGGFNPLGGAVLTAWPVISGLQYLTTMVAGAEQNAEQLESRLRWVEDQNDSLVRAMERKEALLSKMDTAPLPQWGTSIAQE